jgi:hypothetical protein
MTCAGVADIILLTIRSKAQNQCELEVIVDDQQLAEENAEHLKNYFLGQAHCDVAHRWNSGFDAKRFHFANDRKYILDVSTQVLQDSASDKIVGRLKAAHWEQVLESHLGQVPYFTSTGFTFPPCPH